MVDKNLFLYDLSAVAIMKNEARYLKEWLDYHLLAGVKHFYIFDNDSTDNQAEVARPYIEAGLVDYFFVSGKAMQIPVYNEAVKKFKFFSRYMAFIDSDEFIFPKTNQSISEVVDEILSRNPNASGVAIHWQIFGSNGQDKADYSRGVLERFTRRGEKDFSDRFAFTRTKNSRSYKAYCEIGNNFFKPITNPRHIKEMHTHHADYFEGHYVVNENGMRLQPAMAVSPVNAKRIVLNHYIIKSREEFNLKQARGRADDGRRWPEGFFERYDRNEVFDDGILKYRAARAENFSLERYEQRFDRVTEALVETLSGEEISLEAALTCRALSTYLRENFPSDAEYWKICEEKSLDAILKSLNKLTAAESQLLICELPNLLRLPYPAAKELRDTMLKIIPQLMNVMHLDNR